MIGDLSRIDERIQAIQERIAQITAGPDPASAASFQTTLAHAQAAAETPVAPDGQTVRPLSPDVASYADIVSQSAARYNVDPSLLNAVMSAESGGNPRSVSRAGAMGLMQLMPANVTELGITDPFDPTQNIDGGARMLSGLLGQYSGDLDKALAAYNAGPGAVNRYGGIPPYKETQDYVRKVRAMMGK